MTKIGHNTSYIQILPYGAATSIMQRIWDTILKDKSIMLILCGSLITMMKEQTLEYSSLFTGDEQRKSG